MIDPRLLGADCDNCPLQGADPVPAEPAAGKPLFIACAEGPGRVEAKKGLPLAGQSGWLFNMTLDRFEIDRKDVHVTNATLCKPERNLGEREWNQAVEACKPRLEAELSTYSDVPILAMGGKALAAFTEHKKIMPWRGYVYSTKFGPLFPTWHPSYVLRKPFYLPPWIMDWTRFGTLLNGRWKEWKWPKIIIRESSEMMNALTQLATAPFVGVDIEGSGSDPSTAFIRCLGLAVPDLAVSMEWPPKSKDILKKTLDLLKDSNVEKVFHNGNFDLLAFEGLGIECHGYTFDTLTAHFVASPPLGHGLSEVASVEFPAPRWKSIFKVSDDSKGAKFWEKKLKKTDPEELLDYNAKDALMTAMLRPVLARRIRQRPDGPSNFRLAMNLVHISRKMQRVGLLVDPERREKHRKELSEKAETSYQQIMEIAGKKALKLDLDEKQEFNPGSRDQLATLFFDVYHCKIRGYTDTGKPSVNVSMIEELIGDQDEPKEARKLAKLLWNWRTVKKLLSTYIENLPVCQDGRVHCNWKFNTISWRPNASEPNLTNQPKVIRDMYVATPGKYLVAADFGQAEPRVQALRAPEPDLIKRFNGPDDFDYHSYFTCLIFGILEQEFDKNQPQHAKLRQVNKIITLGSSYGGGAKGLHKQVAVRAPDFTIKMIEDVLGKKREAFPNLHSRAQKDIEQARKKGYIDLPFGGGRYYYYLGAPDATQIMNLPQQAGVAKLMNSVVEKIDAELDWSTEAIVGVPHDELVLEGPDPDRLVQLLCEHMPQRPEMHGYHIEMPISVDVGDRWGELKEIGTVRKGESLV